MYEKIVAIFFFFDRIISAGWSSGRIPGFDPGGGGSIPPPATNTRKEGVSCTK